MQICIERTLPFLRTLHYKCVLRLTRLHSTAVLAALSSQLQRRYLFVYYPALVKSVESACPAVAVKASIVGLHCGLYPDARASPLPNTCYAAQCGLRMCESDALAFTDRPWVTFVVSTVVF